MVVEVTELGEVETRRRGIVMAKPVLKGGFKHDVYGRWVGKWAERKSYRHWFERTLGSKQCDFVYEEREGKLVVVEICLSGTAKWNAEQALKALLNDGISELILGCETRKFGEEILKEFEDVDRVGLYRGRVRVCQLAEFME